jgi:hypothetical protein
MAVNADDFSQPCPENSGWFVLYQDKMNNELDLEPCLRNTASIQYIDPNQSLSSAELWFALYPIPEFRCAPPEAFIKKKVKNIFFP